MHSTDTINHFIELRAEDKTLREIADQLKISIGLASKWARDHKDEIDQLAFVRRESLRARYLCKYEDKLADLAGELERIDAELKLREFETVSTEFLLYRKTCLQARLDKLVAAPASTPVPPPVAANSAPEN
ncbi:MAG: hypothetical protein L0Y58_00470 [Verrucomicrobia subdivision 3 bacterium]|nr:hypothetical protein [Limisphaerales bacterium]